MFSCGSHSSSAYRSPLLSCELPALRWNLPLLGMDLSNPPCSCPAATSTSHVQKTRLRGTPYCQGKCGMQHADQLRNPGNTLDRVQVRLMSPEDGTKCNRGNGASEGRTCGLKVPGPLVQEVPGCQQLLRMGFA